MRRVLTTLLLALAAFGVRAQANLPGTVLLFWSAPANFAGLKDYRVHIGRESRNYLDSYTTTNLEYKFSGLAPDTAYYAAVTARDTNGLESVFSPEVIFRNTPPITRLRMTLDDPRTLIIHVLATPELTDTNWDEVATLAVPLREFARFYRVHLEHTNTAKALPKKLPPPPLPH
jgi:hypothetical protein